MWKHPMCVGYVPLCSLLSWKTDRFQFCISPVEPVWLTQSWGSPPVRERALPPRGWRRGPQDGAARRGPPVLTGPRDPRPEVFCSVLRLPDQPVSKNRMDFRRRREKGFLRLFQKPFQLLAKVSGSRKSHFPQYFLDEWWEMRTPPRETKHSHSEGGKEGLKWGGGFQHTNFCWYS